MNRHAVLPAVAAVFLCGCLNLEPVSDPTRHFVLGSMAPAAETTRATPGMTLGLSPVVLPEYLARPWLAVRTSENEIHYSDFNRWGEQLDRGIQRALARNLSQLVDSSRIWMDSWRQDEVDTVVRVVVHQFDVDVNGRVVLDAQWQVLKGNGSSGQRLIERQGPPPAKDPAGAVQAMSAALEDFSRDVAAAIRH